MRATGPGIYAFAFRYAQRERTFHIVARNEREAWQWFEHRLRDFIHRDCPTVGRFIVTTEAQAVVDATQMTRSC